MESPRPHSSSRVFRLAGQVPSGVCSRSRALGRRSTAPPPPLAFRGHPPMVKLYEQSRTMHGLRAHCRASSGFPRRAQSHADGSPVGVGQGSDYSAGPGARPACSLSSLYGVHPIELTTASRLAIHRPDIDLRSLRAQNTRTPSFDDPSDVARWWVHAISHRKLLAIDGVAAARSRSTRHTPTTPSWGTCLACSPPTAPSRRTYHGDVSSPPCHTGVRARGLTTPRGPQVKP